MASPVATHSAKQPVTTMMSKRFIPNPPARATLDLAMPQRAIVVLVNDLAVFDEPILH
jgi:hypothetical protein